MDENTKELVQGEEGSPISEYSEKLIEGLENGLFDCVRDYVKFLGHDASDHAIIVMAMQIALYFSVLDPFLKERLVEFLEDYIKLLRGGTLKRLLTEEEYEKRVSAIVARDKDCAEFNAYALRQLIGFLKMDTAMYRKS